MRHILEPALGVAVAVILWQLAAWGVQVWEARHGR